MNNENNERLFVGVFATGIFYADREREEHGDYKTLACLPFDTLELKFRKNATASLIPAIEAHAAEIKSKRGEKFPVDGCDHFVLLGSATFGPIKYLTCCCCGEGLHGRQWFNRDTGYGLCDKCAIWIRTRETPETMKDYYGISGIHYEVS